MPRVVEPISTTAAPGYIPCFDGLRALSILLVLASHFELSRLIPGGFGVTVFFFISGVLITRLLLAEQRATGGIDLYQFYLRRLLRLMPPLLLMIAITSCGWLALGNRIPLHAALSSVFYYRNYYQYYDHVSHGHSGSPQWEQLWSLSVEEHFYLVFPLLLYLLQSRTALTLRVITALCLLPLVLRCCYCLYPIPLADHYCYHATETRLDAILFGCLLSLVVHHHGTSPLWRRLHRPWLLYACGIGLIASMLLREPFYDAAIKYTVQQLLLMIIIYQLLFTDAHHWLKASLEFPALKYIGRISYSLYLWHLFCFLAVAQLTGNKGVLTVLAAAGLSLALSAASYHLMEEPILRLRKHFSRARTSGQKATHSVLPADLVSTSSASSVPSTTPFYPQEAEAKR